MKGILFAGDSFTWGEGLHYYSDLHFDYNNQKFDLEYIGYDRNKITPAQIQFIKSKRFARKVANNFDTFELVQRNNGGMNFEIFKFIDEIKYSYKNEYVEANDNNVNLRQFHYTLEDFDYVVIQLTDMFREDIKYIDNGITKKFNISVIESINDFKKFLISNFNNNFKTFIDFYLLEYSKFIEKKIIEYETKGIKKCFILTWQNDIIPFIENNPFLNERFVTFKKDKKNYKSIWDLQSKNDRPQNMSITDDVHLIKKGIKITNGHTSLTAHNLIAESIIKKIEENEQSELHTL